jgi:hypothetical protein
MKVAPAEKKSSPRRSIYGYDIYDFPGLEIYRSESDDIYFTCFMHDHNGERLGVCRDTVSVGDGNGAFFFFSSSQISEVRKFEAGIRQLMSQFVAGGNK